MNVTKNIKRVAAGTALAGAVGLGLGLGMVGAGVGQAAPGYPGPPAPPIPGIPGPVMPSTPGPAVWAPGMPPGQNPFGPPGQVMKMPTLDIPGVGQVANPFFGVPHGHWGDVRYLNPQNIVWLPPGFPDLTTGLNLVWNAAANAWGVFVNDVFVPYPVALPAPLPES